jgi:predicted RNase H-like HicB family nuclease
MRRRFTLEYWLDDGWYVGKLKEVPGVFSQGQDLEELKENIADAYESMHLDNEPPEVGSSIGGGPTQSSGQATEVELDV